MENENIKRANHFLGEDTSLNEKSQWNRYPDNIKKQFFKRIENPKFIKSFEKLKKTKQLNTGMLDDLGITLEAFLKLAQASNNKYDTIITNMIDTYEEAIKEYNKK